MQDKEYNIFICGDKIYVYKELKYIDVDKLRKNCQWVRFIEKKGIRMVEYVKASQGLSDKLTEAVIAWCQEKTDIVTVINKIQKVL